MRAAWMLQRAARTWGDSTMAFLQQQSRPQVSDGFNVAE
jgi:hypothetical protein